MSNKYKKNKEAVRTQIVLRLEGFRKNKRILFFDKPTNSFNKEAFSIDENDLEVLLITLSKSKKILVTTQSIYVINKNTTTKIDATEIARFDYMPFANFKEKQDKSIFKRKLDKYRLKRHIGDFRITKKDGSYTEVYLPERNLLYCLSDAIKKLQFVTEKYEIV